MITLWMAYSLFVGALCGLGSWLLESALRPRGVAIRGAWMGAMAVTLALTLAAPWRVTAARSTPAVAVTIAADADRHEAPLPSVAAAGGAAALIASLEAAVVRLGVAVDAVADGRVGTLLAGGWALASVSMLTALGGAFRRSRSERERWPRRRVGGTVVRVAPDTGPMVAGLLRAEIVVPSWLDRAPAAQRELVLAHEREHVRARDPWLLAAGCVTVALLPWNLPLWWMLARLRLAVELDCDARVLRHGVSPLTYGNLLLDLAGRRAAPPIGAAALLDSTRDLERRIMVMTKGRRRQPLIWTAALTALGGLALLAACETRVPTASEIDAMDVNAVQSRIQSTGIPFGAHPDARYFIDDEEVTEAEARALEPGRIGSIQLVRKVGGEGPAVGAAEIRIQTPAALAARGAGPPASQGEHRLGIRTEHHAVLLDEVETFEGLILIDGERADRARLRALNHAEIMQFRVTKGAAAARLHPDPQARNGVIEITTQRAAQRGDGPAPH